MRKKPKSIKAGNLNSRLSYLITTVKCALILAFTPLCRPAVSLFVQFYGCITIFIIFHECYVWYTVVKLFLLSGCCKIYSSISYLLELARSKSHHFFTNIFYSNQTTILYYENITYNVLLFLTKNKIVEKQAA